MHTSLQAHVNTHTHTHVEKLDDNKPLVKPKSVNSQRYYSAATDNIKAIFTERDVTQN